MPKLGKLTYVLIFYQLSASSLLAAITLKPVLKLKSLSRSQEIDLLVVRLKCVLNFRNIPRQS